MTSFFWVLHFNEGFLLSINDHETFRYNVPGELGLGEDTHHFTSFRMAKAITFNTEGLEKM